MGAWLLALSSAAAAGVNAILLAPDGDPVPGLRTELELVTWDANGPVLEPPKLRSGAEVLLLSPGDRPGIWRTTWRPSPSARGSVSLTLREPGGSWMALDLPLGKLPEAALRAPAQVETGAGGGPLTIRYQSDDLPDPEDLQLLVPEGEVRSVARVDGALEITWVPGEARYARVVPLGARDARRPAAPPVWTVITLVASPSIDISTEPGARVTLSVGDRRYGPVVASGEGVATLSPEVYPGETSGQAELVDDLGNVAVLQVPLAPAPGLSLTAMTSGPAEPGRIPPPIHLLALDPSGAPWSGAAPSCRGSAVERVDVVPSAPGRWVAVPSVPITGDLMDIRVSCVLGDAVESVRVPMGTGRPSRVVLQVYPDELTADQPEAQVRAYLEDTVGERLDPAGLKLDADRGVVDGVEQIGGFLRGDYLGEDIGLSDWIRASWSAGVGHGAVSALEVGGGGQSLMIHARDRQGRAVQGAPITVALGGQQISGETDARGWLPVALPPLFGADGPELVALESGDVVRRLVVLPWAPLADAEPEAPDLEQAVEVHVRAGRVREVRITADPAVLYTGAGETARIRVTLMDRAGSPVVDEAVTIAASDGLVGPPRLLPDGSLEAVYRPPKGLEYGSVVLSASGEDGAFTAATNLELQPRPLDRSVAVVGGYLGGTAELSTVYAGLDLDWRLPLSEQIVLLRVSLGGWRDWSERPDTVTGQGVITQRHSIGLISAALAYRHEQGLWALWGGLGPALAPYRNEQYFGDDAAVETYGLHPVGISSFVGGGWRALGGELELELRGVGIQAQPESGVSGQAGGVALVAGYRVLY